MLDVQVLHDISPSGLTATLALVFTAHFNVALPLQVLLLLQAKTKEEHAEAQLMTSPRTPSPAPGWNGPPAGLSRLRFQKSRRSLSEEQRGLSWWVSSGTSKAGLTWKRLVSFWWASFLSFIVSSSAKVCEDLSPVSRPNWQPSWKKFVWGMSVFYFSPPQPENFFSRYFCLFFFLSVSPLGRDRSSRGVLPTFNLFSAVLLFCFDSQKDSSPSWWLSRLVSLPR